MELGGLVDERLNPAGFRNWKEEATTGTTVHAYLLNNYWHTNYKADQEGRLRFRFVLRPHTVEPPAEITAFSRELEQPLLVLPAGRLPRRTTLPLQLDPDVEVIALRPAGDGRALRARLLNAGDHPQVVRPARGEPVRLQPWETITLRIADSGAGPRD